MRKNVLFLIPTLRRGGAESQLISLINSIDTTSFKTYLVCFDRDLDQINRLNSARVEFIHIQRKKKLDRALAYEIAKIINQKKINVVHCTLQIASFIGWCATRLSQQKPKLITTMHGTFSRDFRTELFDLLVYRWIMRSFDAVVFVCETQRQYWEEKWGYLRQVSYRVYNGIDAEYFNKAALSQPSDDLISRLNLPVNRKIIAHIAGFRPEKGHHLLLKAFQLLAEKDRDAHLVFAGDGTLRTEIEQLVDQSGLSSCVTFLGSISDVRPLLACAKIAVIASTAVETFSIAMLEAMAMEVPLVAFDIGGTREAVIPGKTGWLVNPGDIHALSEAMEDALSNEERRMKMARSARELVKNNFTVKTMTEGMQAIFQSITKD